MKVTLLLVLLLLSAVAAAQRKNRRDGENGKPRNPSKRWKEPKVCAYVFIMCSLRVVNAAVVAVRRRRQACGELKCGPKIAVNPPWCV